MLGSRRLMVCVLIIYVSHNLHSSNFICPAFQDSITRTQRDEKVHIQKELQVLQAMRADYDRMRQSIEAPLTSILVEQQVEIEKLKLAAAAPKPTNASTLYDGSMVLPLTPFTVLPGRSSARKSFLKPAKVTPKKKKIRDYRR